MVTSLKTIAAQSESNQTAGPFIKCWWSNKAFVSSDFLFCFLFQYDFSRMLHVLLSISETWNLLSAPDVPCETSHTALLPLVFRANQKWITGLKNNRSPLCLQKQLVPHCFSFPPWTVESPKPATHPPRLSFTLYKLSFLIVITVRHVPLMHVLEPFQKVPEFFFSWNWVTALYGRSASLLENTADFTAFLPSSEQRIQLVTVLRKLTAPLICGCKPGWKNFPLQQQSLSALLLVHRVV